MRPRVLIAWRFVRRGSVCFIVGGALSLIVAVTSCLTMPKTGPSPPSLFVSEHGLHTAFIWSNWGSSKAQIGTEGFVTGIANMKREGYRYWIPPVKPRPAAGTDPMGPEIFAFGAPFRCMRGQVTLAFPTGPRYPSLETVGIMVLSWGPVDVSDENANAEYEAFTAIVELNTVTWIPTEVLWPTFVANAAVYGAVLMCALFVMNRYRASRRAGAGMCKACGYDLAGLENGAVCPECGGAGEGKGRTS